MVLLAIKNKKMIVTDVIRKDSEGKIRRGYYMQGYLKQNLDPIPQFLKKEWDVVGIVSGHGRVGVGKSTIAMQVGYYIAWRLAGGQMICNENNQVEEIIPPKNKVRFGMENIVFSAGDLEKRAKSLPKNSVIVYDEGRSGLDSASAMTAINKAMAEFFQRCRVYHHVIIIVLPNFFKLHEDYAVARSLFLIDCFSDENYERGFFSFFNEAQKEKLFYFGKKKIGVTAKYSSASRNFWGKFTRWMPVDKKRYEDLKKEAISTEEFTKMQKRLKHQRDACFYLLKSHAKMIPKDISIAIMALTKEKINPRTIENAISRASKLKDK